MAVRLWSWLVWALVGASAVFWALKLWDRPQPLPAQASLHGAGSMLQGDLARLLVGERAARPRAAEGEAPTAATTDDARLRLVGVLSPPGGVSNDPREPGGLALIAIDGQPPRVFAVGDAVDLQRVLLRVAQRRADIGFAGQPPQLSLVIPEPSAAVPGAARMGINTPSGAHQSAAVAAGASAAR